jgi:fucose permease
MLIIAAILAIFVYGIIAAMLGTILPDLSKKFNLTPKENGNIAMCQAVGLMIGSFGGGILADLMGLKVELLLGLGAVALALLFLRTASGFGSVAGLMFLLGTGGGAVVGGANGLPPHIPMGAMSAASVSNLLNLFFGLGGLVTPLLASRLFQNNSQKLLMFAAGITALAWGVNGIAGMPAPTGKVAFDPSQVAGLLGKMDLILLSLTLFLYVAAEVGVWNWLVRHLMAQGVSEKKALTILSLGFALGLLIGRVLISQVLGSVSPEHVLVGSAALMAVTTFLMLQTSNEGAAQGLVFLAGMAMAPVFPTALSIVGQRIPDMTATAVGIALTAGWLGLVCSSPLIGMIAGNDPKGLKKALLILPAASVAMLAICLML